jgi:hypothetical protein
MSDITKLLRAIALGTDAQKNKHDIIFNAAAARIEALKQALREIAQQKLSDELDEHEREWADYHDGWDQAVKRARAALAQPDAPVWQPIETAPKDGTVVDLWGTDWEGKAERWTNARWFDPFGDSGFWQGPWSDGLDCSIPDERFKPTHWAIPPLGPGTSPPEPDALKLAEDALTAPEEEPGLRWLLPRDVRAPRRLQQAWRDRSTGRTEWRDVPLVEEVEE